MLLAGAVSVPEIFPPFVRFRALILLPVCGANLRQTGLQSAKDIPQFSNNHAHSLYILRSIISDF
jgi:hypothetical protein